MLTPTLKTSAFLEKGVLNPEEFVRAGDELVFRCPTWSWCGGNKTYLPADKQYLITRNVPCRDRVATLEQTMDVRQANEGGDGNEEDSDWMVSNLPTSLTGQVQSQHYRENDDDGFDVLDEDGEVVVPNPPESTGSTDASKAAQEYSVDATSANDPEDEYADMADYEDDNVLVDDDALVQHAANPDSLLGPSKSTDGAHSNDRILRVRTYDLSITYDNYYRTPRIWMTGTSANGHALTAKETMEDVMTDYANKTVTMEAHPHLPGPHASIHPCKHAKVMKTIVRNLVAMTSSSSSNNNATDGNEGPSVEMYLFIFLKFVSSIIPTINYDFTMDVTANTRL